MREILNFNFYFSLHAHNSPTTEQTFFVPDTTTGMAASQFSFCCVWGPGLRNKLTTLRSYEQIQKIWPLGRAERREKVMEEYYYRPLFEPSLRPLYMVGTNF